MTEHRHSKYVEGCYRCELGRDEAHAALIEERDELLARAEQLEEALRRIKAAVGTSTQAYKWASIALATALAPPAEPEQ